MRSGTDQPACRGVVRTLDATDIASAQAIGDALAFLVSYDKRMLDVAHSFGIPVAVTWPAQVAKRRRSGTPW